MRFFPRFLITATLATLLTSCSRKVDVDVFIVTKGAESVKLGLVEVRAIRMEAAASAIDAALRKRKAVRDEVTKKRELAEKALAELTAANVEKRKKIESQVLQVQLAYERDLPIFCAQLKAACAAAENYQEKVRVAAAVEEYDPRFTRFKHELGTAALSQVLDQAKLVAAPKLLETARRILAGALWDNLPEQRDSVLSLVPSLAEAGERIRSLKSQVAALDQEELIAGEATANLPYPDEPAQELYAVLPKPEHVAKTNADGRCQLTLSSGKWAIAAMAKRELLAGKREDYVWVVGGVDGDKLILSNDNLLSERQAPPGF